jgi:putative flippase GtrA
MNSSFVLNQRLSHGLLKTPSKFRKSDTFTQSCTLNLNLNCAVLWIFYHTSTISRAPVKEKIVGGCFKAFFNFVLIFLIQYQAQ